MIAHRHTSGLLAAALVTSAFAITAHAQTEPQGLYSARTLLDADVYLQSDPGSVVGEVDDLLLGDDMGVHALVVQSDATMGLGGEEVVVANPRYRLETHDVSEGTTQHRVMLQLSEAEFQALPRYDRDWQQQARQRALEAWQATQAGAESAWQQTREGADRAGEGAEQAWERTLEGAERAGRAISEALDDMTSE